MNAEISPTVSPSSAGTCFPTFRRLPGQLRKAAHAFLRFLFRLPGRLWRLFRRIFLSRRAFAVYAVGGTAVCLAYTACRWHWRRAWEEEKQRITASGSSLDLRQLIAPLPPEEENFYATPLLKKWASEPTAGSSGLRMWFNTPGTIQAIGRTGKPYTREVPPPRSEEGTLANWCAWFRTLGTLPVPADAPAVTTPSGAAERILADHRYDDIFSELRKAARRPQSRMLTTLPLDAPATKGNWGHLDSYYDRSLRGLMAAIRLRARAWIAVNNPAEALEDYAVLTKFTDGLLAEGNFSSSLIGSGAVNSDLEALLREGLRNHSWTDDTLQEFLRRDARRQLHAAWLKTGETLRAFSAQQFENYHQTFLGHEKDYGARWFEYPLTRAFPDGLWMRAAIRATENTTTLRGALAPLRQGESWFTRAEALREIMPPWLPVFSPEPEKQSLSDDLLISIAPNFVRQEILRTAIHIERHRLKHGHYPAALGELDPVPSEGIPPGIDGEPLRYRTNAEGTAFSVWSPRYPKSHRWAAEKNTIAFTNE